MILVIHFLVYLSYHLTSLTLLDLDETLEVVIFILLVCDI